MALVMFLMEADGVWTGGYLVLGEPALADVEDGVVKLEVGRHRSVEEFRKEVRESASQKDEPQALRIALIRASKPPYLGK